MHVDTISRKISRDIVLKHAKQFLPHNILKNLHRSTQNRAVRITTNSEFGAPAKPLLANIGLRSISEINENELKLISFKSLDGLAPNYLR